MAIWQLCASAQLHSGATPARGATSENGANPPPRARSRPFFAPLWNSLGRGCPTPGSGGAGRLGLTCERREAALQAQAEGGDPYGDVLEDEDVGSRGNQDVYWTEADRRLLGPCVGLVKAAKASLKKVGGAVRAHGKTETAEQVAQLDDLTDIAKDVSPSVDELVLSTYPPVNQLTLRLNAGKLAAVLKKMLEIARASHVCPASEESWLGFLEGAVDHNMGKIKGLTQALL